MPEFLLKAFFFISLYLQYIVTILTSETGPYTYYILIISLPLPPLFHSLLSSSSDQVFYQRVVEKSRKKYFV